MKNLLTLGIDTSFDETSVSVVRGLTILSNIQPSQMEFHKKYGGVVPSLAKLAHQERIDNVIKEALKQAQVKIEAIDLIAVTQGPGLALALEIGLKKAKELALEYKKPLVLVNHMEGHLLSSFLERNSAANSTLDKVIEVQKFPVLGFLISGAHTELIEIKTFDNYKKIGETLDDSCGEAYDKCGRMLGLGYPAGPVISEFARRHRKNMQISVVKQNQGTNVRVTNKISRVVYELPIAMVNSGDLNFSFSGLKTAFKRLIDKSGELTQEKLMDLCVTFEAAAIAQLTIKLEFAIVENQKNGVQFQEVWLGGGVVASARLRSEIRKVCKKYGMNMKYPFSKKLTGDNAAMIAVVANIKFAKEDLKTLEHNPSEGIYLRDFDQIDRNPTLSL